MNVRGAVRAVADAIRPAQNNLNILQALKKARHTLYCTQVLALSFFTAREGDFRERLSEFWAVEKDRARNILNAADIVRERSGSIKEINDHIGKLDGLIRRLNDTSGLAAIMKFEVAYDEFREAGCEAEKILVEFGKEYDRAGKWHYETSALREKLRDAKRLLFNANNQGRKLEYIKKYGPARIGEYTSFIAREREGLVKEMARIKDMVSLDEFNPLRDPIKMFGGLAKEIRRAKIFICKYEKRYAGNDAWLSESQKLKTDLEDIQKILNEQLKRQIKALDQDELAELDKEFRVLTGILMSERARLEALIGQGYFDFIDSVIDFKPSTNDPKETRSKKIEEQRGNTTPSQSQGCVNGIGDVVEQLEQKINAYEAMQREINNSFAAIDALRKRFDTINASAAGQGIEKNIEPDFGYVAGATVGKIRND